MEKQKLTGHLDRDLAAMKELMQGSADFVTKELTVGKVQLQLLMMEGMVNLGLLAQMIARPLLSADFPDGTRPETIKTFILEQTVMAADQKEVEEFRQIFQLIMSGFVVILIDGVAQGVALGAQGFSFRSVGEPDSEVNERGSREGFTEPLKINMTLIRRRIKSHSLKFESFQVGTRSHTDGCLIYLTDVVSPALVQEIRRRLSRVKLDLVLDTGYLRPFLEGDTLSPFSEVGVTERPDTLCARIAEGRVAILLDGTPYALVTPCLFVENFQSFDDYAHRPYFAVFIRLLKYISFLLTILLPGCYVALATFHPESLPHLLLFNVAAAEETTPFPLMLEALLIHFIYEIMREAGLRLPRPIGHAVGIVGALVIGDAAVTAGLIGSPMVMVVALTAISSFVVPSLYEPMAILRFGFILIGGLTGIFGIALGCGIILLNACRINNLGIPFTAPLSPFTLSAMRDVLFRAGWVTMQRRHQKIQQLRGVDRTLEKEEIHANDQTD